MLGCLNLFNNSVSPASAVVFELHRDLSDRSHFIKLAYKDGHNDNFKFRAIPGEYAHNQCNLQLKLGFSFLPWVSMGGFSIFVPTLKRGVFKKSENTMKSKKNHSTVNA